MIRWDSKELLDETRHELFAKYGREITDTEVLKIVRAFFNMVRKIIGTTRPMDTLCVFSSIEIPKLGKIKLSERAKRTYASKLIWKVYNSSGNVEDQFKVMESLYGYGWRYFKWTLGNGYIFVHDGTEEIYCIKTEEVRSLYEAQLKFLDILEENYLREGIPINKEYKFEPFVWTPIKGIYIYGLDGKFICKYSTIKEVSERFKVPGNEVRKKLLDNRKTAGYHSLIGDFVPIIKDGYVGPRVFNNPKGEVKYTQIVSILDRFSKEVLFDKIGTILEASKFLKYLGKKGIIEPYYIYKRGIIEKRVIYGYKWRREDNAEDDNPQEERN